jgi:hypothetical protein
MLPANPYEPPVVSCRPEEADYPADRCPKFGIPYTFWQAVRQMTPFDFRCTRCRTRIHIRTPHMAFLYSVGMALIIVPGLIGGGLGLWFDDLSFLAISVLALVPVWLALEAITYRMIRAYGRFSLPTKKIEVTAHSDQ